MDKKGIQNEADDDLLAMLEDSQQDFEKKKEEKKDQAINVIDELEEAKKRDEESWKNKEKDLKGVENDFFKGFEEMAKNLSEMKPGEMKIDEKEMKEATNMFKNMFSFPNETLEQMKNDKEQKFLEPNMDPAQSPAQNPNNPFLNGYNKMAEDAKSVNENSMPGLGDMSKMFQDEEFKDFFEKFTQGIFSQEGEGFDPSKMFEGMGDGNPEEMMENMMKEMGGYLEENQDDPQVKNTINEMMSSLVTKDSIYPSLKLMKDEFPKYLEEHADILDVKDLERYNAQLDWIEDICKLFESKDEPPKDEIIDGLFKLQTHGSPPEELVVKMRDSWSAAFPGMSEFGNFPGLGGMGPSDIFKK